MAGDIFVHILDPKIFTKERCL